MFRSFNEIEKYLIRNQINKRVVLCGSHDDISLHALVRAKRQGFVSGILIGDSDKTVALLNEMGESPDDFVIINETRETKAASTAIKMVCNGEADLPMKGMVQTAPYLMAIQNPLESFVSSDSFINEYTAFFFCEQERMILMGDCAVNIAPNLEEKAKILKNLIALAKAFQCEEIKVAAVSIIEKPNPTIQSSVDADALTKMDWGEGVYGEGPFALDNAIDPEAAKHKGIQSKIAGNADILLMPDVHAGNILHKAIHFFGHKPFASGALGANYPIIMNSRTDDENAKFYSIMTGILQTL
jgi:phosphate butyryltransferase